MNILALVLTFAIIIWAITIPIYYKRRKKVNAFMDELKHERELQKKYRSESSQ